MKSSPLKGNLNKQYVENHFVETQKHNLSQDQITPKLRKSLLRTNTGDKIVLAKQFCQVQAIRQKPPHWYQLQSITEVIPLLLGEGDKNHPAKAMECLNVKLLVPNTIRQGNGRLQSENKLLDTKKQSNLHLSIETHIPRTIPTQHDRKSNILIYLYSSPSTVNIKGCRLASLLTH